MKRLFDLNRVEREELVSGQIVLLVARWLLIVAGLMITLWQPEQRDLDRVRVSLCVLLALAVGNFYLHAQLLMRHEVPPWLVYAASAADIVIVSLLTLAYGGFSSRIFVFYFPAAVGFALSFPRRLAAAYAVALLALYVASSLPGVAVPADVLALLERLLALAGVVTVGSLSLGVERGRRRAQRSLPYLSGTPQLY